MKRPYRLLNGKKCLRGCFYSDPVRALNGACARAQWLKGPHRTIEVVNHDTPRLIGSYTRHANGEITFWRNKNG